MKNIVINLLDKPTEHGFMPIMTAYLLNSDDEKRPAVVVFPGGAYAYTSPREAERIALSYNAAGYNAFVVDYCTAPHIHPLPILNAAKAIEIVRENAQEWNVISDKIAVCGFSAGGHLAASISTLWNDAEIFGNDEKKNALHRPDLSILCYPVITSGEYAHKGSFKNLTGSEEETPLWNRLSLENRVDKYTPPAFLWHTYSDNAVPVENSMLYSMALRKNNIPFELHVYENGCHGLSLVSNETIWSVPAFDREYTWMRQSVEWLNEHFGYININK